MSLTYSENDLLVDRLTFSRIACLDGRAFGVESFCEECNLNFPACLRRALISGLTANQALVEDIVGWNLTPRFHEEEIIWNGEKHVQLHWPGIKAVNVEKSTTYITTADVDYFIIEDAPVVYNDNGYCVVTLDKNFVQNPSQVFLRDFETNNVYDQQSIDEFPKKDEDGNWLVALDLVSTGDCPVINVQHCKYAVVIVDTPVCAEGDIQAVLSGTDEVIRFAKDPTVIDDQTVYWFYAWSLVDPAFDGEDINLKRDEFYKLVEQIDLVCVGTADKAAILTVDNKCNCPCSTSLTATLEDSSTNLLIEIVSAEMGIVKVTSLTGCSCLSYCKKPVKIKVYYQTDPAYLPVQASLAALETAITYLTAAELPLTTCQCQPDFFRLGFIYEAQKAYTDVKVNQVTGENIVMLRYGQLHGQFVFTERLTKVKKFSKLIRS